YRVIERVPMHDGSGPIYKAQDMRTGNLVAIKLLWPHFLKSPDIVQAFLSEVRFIQVLLHPNLLPIYEGGVLENDQPYKIEAWWGGPSLQQFLWKRSAPLPMAQVADIASQVGAALDYLHGKGFIHLDISPISVVLPEHHPICLTNFEKMRLEDQAVLDKMRITGRPDYMCPEFIQHSTVSRASDVYSLGIVVYEMLAGTPPFRSETSVAIVLKHIRELPPSLSQFNADLPLELDRVIGKALAKDPDERYQCAGEFVDALTQAMGL